LQEASKETSTAQHEFNAKEGKQIKVIPLELKEANVFVAENHRHHDPVKRDKWRFGVVDDTGKIIGVLHAGRPLSRYLCDGKTIEILRCCSDGTPNLCSFMLGRARKIAKTMGYSKIISYILDTESGTSYKAAGWHKEADVRGQSWHSEKRPRQTTAPVCNKQRWACDL
jgi:hypothetical protein